MSDAERERVVARLQSAVSEGRLTLDEFQERVDGVLRSRTYSEIEPYVADLPTGVHSAPKEVAELKSNAASLKRRGAWVVPRRLLVRNRAGSVKLNFTEAVIDYPVVEIVLDVIAGGTTLVLPVGATVNTDDVEMVAGGIHVRSIPTSPGTGIHFVVSGSQKAGGLTVRHERHFLKWRW